MLERDWDAHLKAAELAGEVAVHVLRRHCQRVARQRLGLLQHLVCVFVFVFLCFYVFVFLCSFFLCVCFVFVFVCGAPPARCAPASRTAPAPGGVGRLRNMNTKHHNKF